MTAPKMVEGIMMMRTVARMPDDAVEQRRQHAPPVAPMKNT